MALIKRPKPLPVLHLTENLVQDIIGQYEQHIKRYDVMVPRCMTQLDSEADILAIRKSGFCDEFEIKLSRADFLKDRKKIVNYRPSKINVGEDKAWFMSNSAERAKLAPWQKLKLDALIDGDMIPNYFWYVIKEHIVDYSDIPEFAGLIEINQHGLVKVTRSPTKLHNRKLSFESRFRYSSLLNERFWKYRVKSNTK